jgi:regulatory protein
MQAIAFLSRREHSRQELRAKLLDSLRKQARDDATLAAAADKAAQALTLAFNEPPANGIDDAFAPSATLSDRPSAAPRRGHEPVAGQGDALAHTDSEAAVDGLLDWLEANKYLSEARFVESRVNARSHKQGTMLIKAELSRHGLALAPEQAATLRETEFARALALWQRRFGAVAPDARLRAKQARFLAARGFASDVVRRVVGGEEEF